MVIGSKNSVVIFIWIEKLIVVGINVILLMILLNKVWMFFIFVLGCERIWFVECEGYIMLKLIVFDCNNKV